MNPKPGAVGAVLLIVAAACAAPLPGMEQPETPRLAILIIVDQMRADYLTRFAQHYESGLARLLADGAVFEDAHHAHARTVTAAGYAALTSGLHPSRNGIVGNSWWERSERREVGVVADPNTRRLDRPDRHGVSVLRMRATTLGDWFKKKNPKAQVWSVGIKDRAAALGGGAMADGAFWYEAESGRFVTSDNYMAEEPDWVAAFDRVRSIEAYRDGWRLLRDAAAYVHADSADGERGSSIFPHAFSEGAAFYGEIPRSPFGDRFTLEFATAMLDGQRLGADAACDLLVVGLSSADYIGHGYGPQSREVEDYYLRLDLMLGEFFEHLDRVVGEGRWIVAFSSDHGVLPLPEHSRREGKTAHRHPWESLYKPAQALLSEALSAEGLGIDSVRLSYANGWVLDANPGVSEAQLVAVRARVAAGLRRDPRVEDVFTWDELASPTPLDRPYEEHFRNSFDPARSADLLPRFLEFDLPFSGAAGTTHGSPYPHDTHVPMVFLGHGVEAGREPERAWTVDLAPTLAHCVGLEAPDDLDGEIRPVCRPPRTGG